VTDGVNGFVCEDTTEALTDVLRRALSQPERTRAMGIEARRTIPLPWDTVIDRAVVQYRALIDERKM